METKEYSSDFFYQLIKALCEEVEREERENERRDPKRSEVSGEG